MRAVYEFKCPFPPPSQADINAILALGPNVTAILRPVPVQRALRMLLPGDNQTVRRLCDVQGVGRASMRFGPHINQLSGTVGLRFEGLGVVSLQPVRERKLDDAGRVVKKDGDVDFVLSAKCQPFLDMSLVMHAMLQFDACGYHGIPADVTPTMHNIVIQCMLGGRLDKDALRLSADPRFVSKKKKKRAKNEFNALILALIFRVPGVRKPPKCKVLLFDTAALNLVCPHDETTALNILAMLLPCLAPHHRRGEMPRADRRRRKKRTQAPEHVEAQAVKRPRHDVAVQTPPVE